jgi:hypothetical protein
MGVKTTIDKSHITTMGVKTTIDKSHIATVCAHPGSTTFSLVFQFSPSMLCVPSKNGNRVALSLYVLEGFEMHMEMHKS